MSEKDAKNTHPNYFRPQPHNTLMLVRCWYEISDHWINGREALKNMVSQAGFEPATFPLGGGIHNPEIQPLSLYIIDLMYGYVWLSLAKSIILPP